MNLLLNFHLSVILVVAFFSFPLTYLFLSKYEVIMQVTLLTLLVNNLVFIALSVFLLERIRVSVTLFLLFFFFFSISFSIGLANNGLTSKFIVDSAYLCLFFLKIVVIKTIIENYHTLYIKLIKFLKRYVFISLFAGILGIIFFYVLPSNVNAYAGLTPALIPFLIYSLLWGGGGGALFSLFLIVLTGKRAMLMAALFLILLYYSTKMRRWAYILVFVLLVLFLLQVFGYNFDQILALSKLIVTFMALFSGEAAEFIFSQGGYRLAEIVSIYHDSTLLELILGKGPGYIYEMKWEGEVLDESHFNAHFTPIAILSKYGLVIFFLIYFVIFSALSSNQMSSKGVRIFLKFYLIAFLLESNFSYLIFNDKILPIVIAILLARTGKSEAREKVVNDFFK